MFLYFFGSRAVRNIYGDKYKPRFKHLSVPVVLFIPAILWQALSLFDTASYLTHWGRETHICISNLTIIGLDNGVSLGRRQAIISTNVDVT